MKGYIIVFIAILFLSCFSGCTEKKSEPCIKTQRIANVDSSNVENEQKLVNVKISADMAIKLCENNLGKIDEETGFILSYRCIDMTEFDGLHYYVIYRTWIVDGNNSELSHPSFIGYALVSLSGDEIYDGMKDDSGKYKLGNILWEK